MKYPFATAVGLDPSGGDPIDATTGVRGASNEALAQVRFCVLFAVSSHWVAVVVQTAGCRRSTATTAAQE